jgi:hypothetical protein
MVKSQVSAEYLDQLLGALGERGEVRVEYTRPDYMLDKKGGRPKRLYFYEPNAKLPPLLEADLLQKEVESSSGIPTVPLGRPPEQRRESGVQEGNRRCVWCGKPLPEQESGRPRLYCDDSCKANSGSAAGRKFLQVLFGNEDIYKQARVAKLVVAADLITQGYTLLGAVDGNEQRLYVKGEGNIYWTVTIYVMHPNWTYFEGEDGGDVKAVIRRDGVIDYVSKPAESTEPA